MRTSHYVPRDFMGQRAQFVNAFVQDLEKPYRSFLTTQLNQLVGRNEAFTGAPCFYVGDTVYARNLTIAKIGKLKLGGMAMLDSSLADELTEFLDHYREHTEGWQRFSQSLKVLMSGAESWQDLRDMFPDHVLQPQFEKEPLHGLTRVRVDLHTAHLRFLESPSQTSSWDPKLIHQYQIIRSKLDLYVGYRLL